MSGLSATTSAVHSPIASHQQRQHQALLTPTRSLAASPKATTPLSPLSASHRGYRSKAATHKGSLTPTHLQHMHSKIPSLCVPHRNRSPRLRPTNLSPRMQSHRHVASSISTDRPPSRCSTPSSSDKWVSPAPSSNKRSSARCREVLMPRNGNNHSTGKQRRRRSRTPPSKAKSPGSGRIVQLCPERRRALRLAMERQGAAKELMAVFEQFMCDPASPAHRQSLNGTKQFEHCKDKFDQRLRQFQALGLVEKENSKPARRRAKRISTTSNTTTSMNSSMSSSVNASVHATPRVFRPSSSQYRDTSVDSSSLTDTASCRDTDMEDEGGVATANSSIMTSTTMNDSEWVDITNDGEEVMTPQPRRLRRKRSSPSTSSLRRLLEDSRNLVSQIRAATTAEQNPTPKSESKDRMAALQTANSQLRRDVCTLRETIEEQKEEMRARDCTISSLQVQLNNTERAVAAVHDRYAQDTARLRDSMQTLSDALATARKQSQLEVEELLNEHDAQHSYMKEEVMALRDHNKELAAALCEMQAEMETAVAALTSADESVEGEQEGAPGTEASSSSSGGDQGDATTHMRRLCAELQLLVKESVAQRRTLSTRCNDLVEQVERVKVEVETTTASLSAQLQQDMSSAQRQHQQELDTVKQEHRNQLAALEAEFSTRMQQLNEKHQTALSSVQNAHAQKLTAAVRKQEQLHAEREQRLREMVDKATAQLHAVTARQDQDLQVLEENHQGAMRVLAAEHTCELHARTGALQRDVQTQLREQSEAHQREMSAASETHALQLAETKAACERKLETALAEHRRELDMNKVEKARQLDAMETGFAAQQADLEEKHAQQLAHLTHEYEERITRETDAHTGMIRQQQRKHEQEVCSLKEEHAAEISSLASRYDEKTVGILEEHERQLAGMKAEHAQQLEKKDAEHAQHVNCIKAEHAQQLEKKDAEHAQHVNCIKAEHAQQLEQKETEHAQQLDSIKTEHVQQLDSIKAEHAQEVNNIKAEHAHHVDNIKAEHAQQLEQKDAEHVQQVDTIKAEHAHHVDSIKAEHNATVQALDQEAIVLRVRIEELSSAIKASNARLQALSSRHQDELAEAHAQADKALDSTASALRAEYEAKHTAAEAALVEQRQAQVARVREAFEQVRQWMTNLRQEVNSELGDHADSMQQLQQAVSRSSSVAVAAEAYKNQLVTQLAEVCKELQQEKVAGKRCKASLETAQKELGELQQNQLILERVYFANLVLALRINYEKENPGKLAPNASVAELFARARSHNVSFLEWPVWISKQVWGEHKAEA